MILEKKLFFNKKIESYIQLNRVILYLLFYSHLNTELLKLNQISLKIATLQLFLIK